MGPIETMMRSQRAELARDLVPLIAFLGTNFVARQLVYEADMQLRREQCRPHLMARGLSEIVESGDLPDVLTEAICAAEALNL